MTKRFFTLIFLLITTNYAIAQVAPDFTVTDSDGNSINLYTLLDEGNTVMLDLFFVGCPYCEDWDQDVETFYNKFGAGNGNFKIIGLSDRDSDTAINSHKSSRNLTHPMAGTGGNAPAIINQYAAIWTFTGFPTYAIICPDKSITWDVWPVSAGVPQLENAIVACGATLPTTSVEDLTNRGGIKVYPNPTQGMSIIEYQVEKTSDVTIELFNLLGKRMETLVSDRKFAGIQNAEVDLTGLPVGQYFIKVNINNEKVRTVKLSHVQ